MNGVTVCTVKTNRQDWTLVGGRFLKVSTLKKIRGWVYQMPTKLEERKHCQQATACSTDLKHTTWEMCLPMELTGYFGNT